MPIPSNAIISVDKLFIDVPEQRALKFPRNPLSLRYHDDIDALIIQRSNKTKKTTKSMVVPPAIK